MKNYYRILDVAPDADPEAIERAYRRLARRYDPSANPSNEAKARLRNVNEAYETLADPRARAEYDRKRSAGQGGGSRPGEAQAKGNRRVIIAAGILTVLAAAAVAGVLIALNLGGGDEGNEAVAVSTVTPGVPATPGTPGPGAPESPPGVDIPPRVTESGLQIIDVTVGTGAEAVAGVPLTVHYTGWLEDGTKFSSSLDGGQPFPVTLGQTPLEVILGWEEGLPGMRAGGKRRLIIPPDLAYGETGSGDLIPANATLTFDIELLAVGEPTPGATGSPTPGAAGSPTPGGG